MPASKPGTLPRWADVGGNIVNPPSGKKDVGWVAAEAPSDGYWNWFNNLTYQWAAWLNDFEVVPHTWTSTQTFAAAVFTGVTTNTLAVSTTSTFTGVSTFTATPVLNGGFTSNGTSQFNNGFTVNTGQAYFNGSIYSNATASLPGVFAFGSGANAAVWARSATGATGIGVRGTIGFGAAAGARALRLFKEDSSSFPDPSYNDVVAEAYGAIKFMSANPVKTTAIASNSLTGLNMMKAWISYTHNNSVTPAYNDGCNISAVSAVLGAPYTVTVSFATPMLDANYLIKSGFEGMFGSYATLGMPTTVVTVKTTTGFSVEFRGTVPAAQLTAPQLSSLTMWFEIVGRQ